ncbi:MAG: ATP-dependent DNA helicase RecG [Micrococcales bacterium]|nr:ATP-dependent DNA helicase RecG [Micrococcales bacterium]MCL2666870.1 ATP-dependent DNA helicase RecG [Micrococcales bacterium]
MVRASDGVGTADLLDEPLTKHLAPGTARALAALGPVTVGDLLRFYPRRYVDPGVVTPLADLKEGDRVMVVGEVKRASMRRTAAQGKTLFEVVIADAHDEMRMVFFANSSRALGYHHKVLQRGCRAWFSGVVHARRGAMELRHPKFEEMGDRDLDPRDTWPKPVYPASAAIDSGAVGKAVATVLGPLHPGEVDDPLPDDVRTARGLIPLVQALRQVHEPHCEADWRTARARLRFEEAFVLQAELVRRRAQAADHVATARPARAGGLLDAFDARLPFTLTDGQRQVGAELAHELGLATPMQRLLQGEVGSGKTVVALRAMLQVVDAGGQAALLAPTEVLAAQHLATLRTMLGDLAQAGELGAAEHATSVTLLTGSLSAAARRQVLADAAGGAAGIVVGTHALLGDQVQFADLGLVVVDEQHRFGVEQRDALRTKAATVPHTLVMTATPIPRTVAMTVFGDLETSTLREVPAGRSAVVTHAVHAERPAWMARTWQRVAEAARTGGRAYVVAPRIDATDEPEDLVAIDEETAETRPPLCSVLDVAAQLADEPALDGVGIGVLHGRITGEAKERAFADFASGRVPVLVATTVVEVGVDVPEATVMVVLDADRFGISQLHQLRGRVGRGTTPGLCLLVSPVLDDTPVVVDANLDTTDPERTVSPIPAVARLRALERTTDGFELARLDLEQRREGDVLGAAQSGTANSLRLLRVTRDEAVIIAARTQAQRILAADPALCAHPALAKAIADRLAQADDEFLDRA